MVSAKNDNVLYWKLYSELYETIVAKLFFHMTICMAYGL
jgi:hypothetical protein